MAKTAAERQRAYKERMKEKEKIANISAFAIFRTPFFEFYNQQSTGFAESLAIAGMDAPEFDDDRGPRAFGKNGVFDNVFDDPGLDDSVGSLGRAELVLEALLDAAGELAGAINDYKRIEVQKRIAEIEVADLTDPTTKKAALQEVTRLNNMLDQLSKQVRWTLPQWKVTG